MDELLNRIAEKKAEFDRLRPLLPAGLGNLEHAHDLELTHTSNAIEGNTRSIITMPSATCARWRVRQRRSPRWTCAICTAWS